MVGKWRKPVETWGALTDILILLAGALVLGGVFSRLGQSPLLGYLIAGMIMGGPGSARLVHSDETIEGIAELGVTLLLFSLGLEFSLNELRKLGGRTLLAGFLQVAVTTALGGAVAYLLGLPAAQAFTVGALVSLSSTAVILRLLVERADIDSAHGRRSLAVALVQDIAFVPMALILAILGGAEEGSRLFVRLGQIGLASLVLVLGLYLILNKFAVYALRSLSVERNRELVLLLAVLTGLGSAWAAYYAGISPALGAFLAGMFLGSSPFATQIRADVAPLRIILLTLFFGAAGMTANPVWIAQNLHIVLAATALLMLGKLAIVWVLFVLFGQPSRVAAATGICLSQIGEFAFVLGTLARNTGVLQEETYRLIVAIAIVSLLLSPFLIPRAATLGSRLAAFFGADGSVGMPEEDRIGPDPDVVIIGFGPAGSIASQAFLGRNEAVRVIDLNFEGVRRARHMGFSGLYGDATQLEVLEDARVAAAKVVVITIPHQPSALTILDLVRNLAPQAHTLVRSRYQIHTEDFVSAGADAVTGDEEEVGEALAQHLREWIATSQPSEPAASGS